MRDDDAQYAVASYAFGINGEEITLEGLKGLVRQYPDSKEVFRKETVLHHYLASSAPCPDEGGYRDDDWPPRVIDIEVVKYLLELTPDAANQVDGSSTFPTHRYGSGAFPLHLACFNADCPVSIIKLLLEKNPDAARHSWQNGGDVLPLHCYIGRSAVRSAWGTYDDDGDFIEDMPSFPSGEIDIDIVKLLIEAYPEALEHNLQTRSALHLLCEGMQISMELVQLLIDKDGLVLEDQGEHSTVLALLYNCSVSPFPSDVLKFLLHHNASALTYIDEKEEFAFDHRSSSLHTACANKNMTAEVIRLLLNLKPDMKMIKAEDQHDGCLPLHVLCQNQDINEESAIEIMKLLVDEYPNSLRHRVGKLMKEPWLITLSGTLGKLPIHLAEENMSLSFCKALLQQYARFSTSIQSGTILQMACRFQCTPSLIKDLINDDRDLLQMQDDCKHVVLHTAAKYSSLDIVKYLVDEDESMLTRQDKLMECALHKACRERKIEIIEYLMTKNMSSVTIRNKDRELPVQILSRKSSRDNHGKLEATSTVFKMLQTYPETMMA